MPRTEIAAMHQRWVRARSILARSFLAEMRTQGYSHGQVLELCSELLGLVTQQLRQEKAIGEPHPEGLDWKRTFAPLA